MSDDLDELLPGVLATAPRPDPDLVLAFKVEWCIDRRP